jgi:hypothetical protein
MAIHHTAPLPKRVRFSLPCNRTNQDSSSYCQRCPHLNDRTQVHPTFPMNLQQHATCDPTLSTTTLREGVLNGTIPLAVSNTGATLHALLPTAPSIPTITQSIVVFHLPDRTTAAASTVNKLLHNIPEPVRRSANIVPTLANNSLISTRKFVNAGYAVVCDNKEGNYYENATTKIVVSKDAVLKGWRCPCNKLWRVPLVPNVQKLNSDTILLDHPLG